MQCKPKYCISEVFKITNVKTNLANLISMDNKDILKGIFQICSKEQIQIANGYVKKYSGSQAIKKYE